MGRKDMKRLLAVLMVMILTVFISACGSNDSSSSTSKTAGDTNSLEGILTIIAHDFDDTTKELNDELKKAQKAVGGTFDGYCKNEKICKKRLGILRYQVFPSGCGSRI